MKPKLIFCLALVLGGNFIARAGETNPPASITPDKTTKTIWKAQTNAVFDFKGASLNGSPEKRSVKKADYEVDLEAGNLPSHKALFKFPVITFVSLRDGNAYVLPGDKAFYIETDSGIVAGLVVAGNVQWYESYNMDTNGMDAAIVRFEQQDVGKQVRKQLSGRHPITSLAAIINIDLLVDRPTASQVQTPRLETIRVKNGQLQLDFKGLVGKHTASVWIDIKSRKVVKAIQDGKQVYP